MADIYSLSISVHMNGKDSKSIQQRQQNPKTLSGEWEEKMSNIKLLKECSVRKGGHNELPTRPRPKTPPEGQGGEMSKYLEFQLLEQKPKTKVIEVLSKEHESSLGIIKWFSRWRQYAFFPQNETVFNVECLNDIQSYIRGLR